jgi:uncharacterized tellurite resistance protein B-like protein
MLKALTALVLKLIDDQGPRNPLETKSSRLAIAALLVRLATVESEISEARRKRLCDVLKSGLGLDDAAAVQLIDEAIVADRNAVDLYHFTRQLNAALDDEGRRRFVRMMWDVVQVDKCVSDYENNIIWRIAELLGVPSRERIELRRRVGPDKPLTLWRGTTEQRKTNQIAPVK